MANSAFQGDTEKKGLFKNMANPVLRRMAKKGEYDSDVCATYSGIVGKTVYFLLVTVVGFLIISILNNIAINTGTAIHVEDTKNYVYDVWISIPEAVLVVIAAIVSIIIPFVNYFVRRAIPVVGTIYCVAQGIFIGFISNALAKEYKWASMLAVVLTLALVAAMLFVYAKRIITVTAKFKGVIVAVFLSIVLGGIIVFLLNLIPGVRSMMTGVNEVLSSPVTGIILAVVFVIIAALFMLADFDTIQKCVEARIDKSFEWTAAWGLAYTILYIYFKILRIIIMVLGNSKSSSK